MRSVSMVQKKQYTRYQYFYWRFKKDIQGLVYTGQRDIFRGTPHCHDHQVQIETEITCERATDLLLTKPSDTFFTIYTSYIHILQYWLSNTLYLRDDAFQVKCFSQYNLENLLYIDRRRGRTEDKT